LDKNNFDQLIVNEYKPGQGIYKHIDHVKYFGPIILCITCGSGCNIEFSREDTIVNIYVEPKSLYIMSGDARYKWRHGINNITTDIINNGILKKVRRDTRYSITFRSIIN
jgi:alkylated DNA repair dioxygenase AlkB